MINSTTHHAIRIIDPSKWIEVGRNARITNKTGPSGKKQVFVLSSISTKKLKLVIADDDAEDRELFEEALGELNRKVELEMCGDGDSLLHMLKKAESKPDILFLDLNMPVKNGFDCLREIKIHPELSKIIIIIYSTSSSPQDINMAFESGADYYVNKPTSFTELKGMLEKVLSIDPVNHKRPARINFVLTQSS